MLICKQCVYRFVLSVYCFRMVVGSNNCAYGTYNANGVKCAGIWKYDAGYPWCLGGLSANTMAQDAGHIHCSNQNGTMLQPFNQYHTERIQIWREHNGANVQTWMQGQRVQSSTTECVCKNDCWLRPNPWYRWYWMHYAWDWDQRSGQAPWDSGEPKSSCYAGEEKCFSMGTNGRWKDRHCTDKLQVLCETNFATCHACTRTDNCGAGNYRTACSAGSTTDSSCAVCSNNPLECGDNSHRVPCESGRTQNTCTACRSNLPFVRCPNGQWLRPCDKTRNTDTSSCEPCGDTQCPVDTYKLLCNPNRMTMGENTCQPCAHTLCSPGFFLTRCTGNTLSDISTCTACAPVNCGDGQFMQQCVAPDQAHSCQTCTTTQNCSAGSFRPACIGPRTTDAVCTGCTGATYASESGASVCRTCSAGSARANAYTCSQCSAGTYVSVPGTSACIACQEVSTTVITAGVAIAPGSTLCTACKWHEYWFSPSQCKQCEPGQYLDRSVIPVACKACAVVDSGYCANIKVEMDALQYAPLRSQMFNTACKVQFGANTAQLCEGCRCGLFRNNMLASVQDTCVQINNSSRSYLHGHTRNCQNCPVNKLINRDVLHRSCSDALHFAHAQWDETRSDYACVPGYMRVVSQSVRFLCSPCALGTYKDNTVQHSCTACPGNTITRSIASISLQDCAFCSAGQRLAQSVSSGDFSCEPCALCTTTRDSVHMERICPPCTLYEYDAKIPGHPATCVLKYCVDAVRTDVYSNSAHIYNGDPQFAYIGPTTFQGGATSWADGVLLMFVTAAQWEREIQRQENTGLAGTSFLDRLNSFATNFRQYTMIPLNPPTIVESFRFMRQNGTPLYVSFQDAYSRLLMRSMNASIAINPISGFDTQSYLSSWTALKQTEFAENIQSLLHTYSLLDTERLQREIVSQSVLSYPFVPPRDVVALSYKATGGIFTSLVFELLPAGATFQLLTEISFRGTVLSASMCDTDNIRNGQRCASMFVGNSNVLHFNNTHRSMHSIDLSMVFLEDIHFSVLSATGVNSLAFHASIPISSYADANTPPDAMFGVLDWREKTPVYRACAQDESTSKRATITDPWVFTHVRAAFHRGMCTNLDYA